MVAQDSAKSRRLNIVISDQLVEWASSTAEMRGISVSAFVRDALEKERQRSVEREISEAATSLAHLYESDAELRAFSALDGEDFT
jgi:post-segregation antitoxin (ccd killing protein)